MNNQSSATKQLRLVSILDYSFSIISGKSIEAKSTIESKLSTSYNRNAGVQSSSSAKCQGFVRTLLSTASFGKRGFLLLAPEHSSWF